MTLNPNLAQLYLFYLGYNSLDMLACIDNTIDRHCYDENYNSVIQLFSSEVDLKEVIKFYNNYKIRKFSNTLRAKDIAFGVK